MITIRQNLGQKSILAALTIKDGNGERTSYYRPNKTYLTARVVNKDSIDAIATLAMEAHKAIQEQGRAYKIHQGVINQLMTATEASNLVHLNLMESIRSVKSKAQLDSALYDLVMLCAQACAYYQSDIDSNYFQPEGVTLTVPELIQVISEGGEPILTVKQAKSINEIATRKQAKGDTSANWELVIKHAWC